jgi:hypothetical protein
MHRPDDELESLLIHEAGSFGQKHFPFPKTEPSVSST